MKISARVIQLPKEARLLPKDAIQKLVGRKFANAPGTITEVWVDDGWLCAEFYVPPGPMADQIMLKVLSLPGDRLPILGQLVPGTPPASP